MSGRWLIRKVPLVLGLCTLMVALPLLFGRLAPPRPQIYYLSWQPAQSPLVVALDVERNASVQFVSEPPLPWAAVSDWALSPDGRHLVFKSNFDLIRANLRGGRLLWLTRDEMNNHAPAWSPDGTRIAFVAERDNNGEIFVMNADGSNPQRLTANTLYDDTPVWSPDGQQIAYTSVQSGSTDICVIDADGGNPRRLTAGHAENNAPVWSPDGGRIAFVSYRDGDADIYVTDSEGNNQHPLTVNDADDLNPSWSPDGGQIVFKSNRDRDTFGIYRMDADGTDQHFLVATEGGDSSPSWSPDGHFITFYGVGKSVGQTYLANADGSGLRLLTTDEHPVYSPVWFLPPP
jgi:Tol biopolymer transport system component